MALYYILNSLEEAKECERACFDAYITSHIKPEYVSATTKWADEIELGEGTYAVRFCEKYDNSNGYIIQDIEGI